MVVSVIAGSDWSIRDKMEAHLVGDLTDRGYVAVSAIKEYGPKYFENMKEAEVLDKLSNSGVDAGGIIQPFTNAFTLLDITRLIRSISGKVIFMI